MTTIQAASLSALEIGSSGNSSGGNDIASRISQLTKQLTKATQQLKELGLSDAPLDEKKKQQELLESQITMLQAQLAQLQRQQAEEAMPKQEKGEAVAEGINKPSAEHQINIYV